MPNTFACTHCDTACNKHLHDKHVACSTTHCDAHETNRGACSCPELGECSAGTPGVKQAPGKRPRHGPPSPRKVALGIHSPSIGLPLQPSIGLDPPAKVSPGPVEASDPHRSQPVNLQSPPDHDAAPTAVPQALEPHPAAVTAPPSSAAPGSWQSTSQNGGPSSAAGAGSALKADPTAVGAAQLQGGGSIAATEPAFTAQPMQLEGQSDLGSAASAQLGSGPRMAGEAPTPKPQRTLWHPHTGESLSGWKQAVSAAQEANQQAASDQGVKPSPHRHCAEDWYNLTST